MSDKHLRRVKQYLEDLCEERDDLFQNVDKLINNAQQNAQNISKSNASLSEKEALLTFLTKTIALFSELNHMVLKNLESIDTRLHVETNNKSNADAQELQDYLKGQSICNTLFDYSQEGPKVPNDQMLNESYIRKPLDDTTLKAICSTLINNSSTSEDALALDTDNRKHGEPNNIQSGSESNSLIHQHETRTFTNRKTSPSLSESDVFSTTGSSIYQHPLSKFRPPNEIPDQYDKTDLEKVRENMMYISRKMGFDSKGFAQMSSQFDKKIPCVNFQYEEPVRDVEPEESDLKKDSTESVDDFQNVSAVPIIEQNETPNYSSSKTKIDSPILLNNQTIYEGPPKSTGAIRKHTLLEENLMEFSASTSDDESCDKVNTWLRHNDLEEKKRIINSDLSNPTKKMESSAIEKLEQTKRFDRHEEARNTARAEMPNLKFIEVETPQVIKNNLNTDISSFEPSMRDDLKKKCKIRSMYSENGMTPGIYAIKKVKIPQIRSYCVFSHIVSPNEFYLQIVDENTANLDLVSNKLIDLFKKIPVSFKSKKDAYEQLGKYCSGCIWGEKKSCHFRLEVLDWKLGSSSDDVEVQSVDYGFRCSVSYTHLRALTKDLGDIPMFAIKCHLPLLYPPGSTYSNRLTEWPDSAIEALYDIANLSRDIHEVDNINMFQISFTMLEGDSLGVDLDCFSETSQTIGELLVEMGLAVEINDEYEEYPEVADFLEDIDELETADNLNEFLLGYDAKDEARICRFTRKDGTCYKGKHCKKEHIQVKDGYTTDKKAVFYTAINDLIFPTKGETIQVLVTTYLDSCTYLVQLVRSPVTKDSLGIVMDKEMSQLMDAMNHPKIVAKYTSFKIYPAVGEVILAYHPLTKMWIRGAVRELNKNGNDANIEVYSVDFGEEFVVNTKNIRMMQEEFMHVPFQVIQVYLDNYQHRKDCDMKKAKKFFNKHLAFKSFMATIKSNDLPYKINLSTFKGRDIGPTLAKEGFAEKRMIDHYISEDMQQKRCFDLE